ncbi:MAG: hypothetical protein GY715_06955 [Planctomycetes bacterium]|nr:hypothetical protein [Planctomycetota bacterium]
MLGLDRTFRTIAGQVSGFSPTARLLVGAILVIMMMALVMVAMVTGRAEMVPLGLGGNLTPEVRTRAISYLDERRVEWVEAANGDVLVPLDQKYAVLAQLTENELITTDQINFKSIIEDDSPFLDRSTKAQRYLVAKMNEVARMIGALEGVQQADVMIDQPDRPGGFGITRIEPTASVSVRTRSGALTRSRADAIARMVAGAHAELKVGNVIVVDARSGRTVTARTPGDLAASEHLEQKKEQERYHHNKIAEFLNYIPNVRVAVNAQVDGSEVVRKTVGVDEAKHGTMETRSRDFSSTNATQAAEPGVRANAGEAIAAGRNRSSSMTETEGLEKTLPVFGTQESTIKGDRGFATKINATIKVPRSWFLRLYRQETGEEDADSTSPQFQSLVDAEVEKIRADVEPLIDTTARNGATLGTVVVSMFTDFDADGTVASGLGGGFGTVASGATGGGGGLASEGLIRSVTLGALAVVSLLLMFMMVRKASRQEEMPTAEELVGIPPALAEVDEALVGEADETVAAMEGVEIDEGSVRRSQMLEQINDLAQNRSDEVAGLLRKWIKTDD